MDKNIPSQIVVRQEKGGWSKRSFAFMDNETVMATLKYDNSFENKAQAIIAGKEFQIRRRGFWKYYLTIGPSLSTEKETRIDLDWRGGLKITQDSGGYYAFKSTGLWKPRWKWFDRHGRTLIEIKSNQFSKKNRGTINITYEEMQDPIYWIVISWFVIICAESDAVAVAVT